jgi:hypothetical protein
MLCGIWNKLASAYIVSLLKFCASNTDFSVTAYIRGNTTGKGKIKVTPLPKNHVLRIWTRVISFMPTALPPRKWLLYQMGRQEAEWAREPFGTCEEIYSWHLFKEPNHSSSLYQLFQWLSCHSCEKIEYASLYHYVYNLL